MARERPDPWASRIPPLAQPREQLRREDDVAVPLPLALLDPQGHALAVDIQISFRLTTSDTRRPAP